MLQYPQKITLCGFGGQGIILTAVMLGTAAVTKGGLYAVQTQSYGSEARGGQCQAELIMSPPWASWAWACRHPLPNGARSSPMPVSTCV